MSVPLAISTGNWLLGALVLAVGVIVPVVLVARHNKLLFASPAAKRSA